MTTQEFATKLKAKNPQWASFDDKTLVDMVVQRYPVYKKQINDTPIATVETVETPEDTIDQTEKKPGFFQRAGTALKERFSGMKETWKKTAGGTISPIETGLRTVGDVVGGLGDILGAAVEPAVKPAIEKIAQTNAGKAAFNVISLGQEAYNAWKDESEANNRVAETIESLVNIADLFGATAIAKKGAKETVEMAGNVAGKLAGGVEDTLSYVKNTVPELGEKAAKIISSEPDETVKTILQRTNTDELDNYLKIAEAHSKSLELDSGFDVVSKKMVDAAKEIEKRLSELGKQKDTIISRTKLGAEKFTKAPSVAIDKIKALEVNELTKSIIEKLKTVKTKLDADKAIDDIQDMIYSGGKKMIIAEGSVLEKRLKGIVGELNNSLKDSLPDAYRALNNSISEGKSYLKTLNRGLGEKVGGVASQGAGLVKRFFSPASSKTKELFKYINDTVGIDLAKDVSLAKFAESLYDNPTVRSLLEGIPKTRAGAIDKIVDFVVEKSGVGKKAQETLRRGLIEKAKELTK